MRSKRRIAAVALAALMVLSVVGPALAVAQEDTETETTDDGGDLTFDVREGGNDTVLVVVEDENGSVEGATVTVTAENTEDAGNETDDDETEETVEDNETEDEETVEDNETEDEETTEDNETTYEGTGTYTTDANGTVELPAPDDGVRLNVEVEDGNRTTSADVTLNDGTTVPFGQRVSGLIQQLLQDDGDTSVGQAIAEFVRGNNPGNAPESAGPPEDRGNGSDARQGPPEDRGPDGEQGPPEDRGNGSDAERGPPEDRGNGSDAERGPPEDRGGDSNDGQQGPSEDRGGNGGDGSQQGPPQDDGDDEETDDA